MGTRKDQDYPFIKETIKQRPIDKRELLKKIGTAALCGVVFGLCAVVTLMVCMPEMVNKYEQQIKKKETVQITPSVQPEGEPEPAVSVASSQEPQVQTGSADAEESVTVDHLKNIYKMVRKIAEKPQKALVCVAGLTGDSDLLNDSLLTYGDEEGIVFLKNEDGFYIVTTSDRLEQTEKFRITFSNGDSAEGELCGADSRTKLIVIRVLAENLKKETIEEIPAVPLATEENQEQTQPVIAIGSPAGNMDSLIYGSITSVSGKMNIADAEYSLITTDMAGGQSGGGVLLDMNGRMTGIIIANDSQESSVLRAVSAAQIRTLLEMLSNGKPICYVGIRGTTIPAQQSEQLNIPQGVYVDRVEQDSPAMNAGMQSGDILYKLDGQTISSVKEYSRLLQAKEPGDRIHVTLHRKSPAGEYADVELSIIIKEKQQKGRKNAIYQ